MSWITNRSPSESLHLIREVSHVCAKLGGPLSKNLFRLLEDGRILDLINHKFDYSDPVSDYNDFLYARQIHGLVSKQDFVDLGIDKEAVAFSKFIASEEKCKDMNEFFYSDRRFGDAGVVFHYAQRKICQILGPVPNLSDLKLRFGPGATTSVKKSFAHPLVKFKDSPRCSRELALTAESLLEEAPHWRSLHLSKSRQIKIKVTAGKLTFVPKDSRTYRSICIEPNLNGFLQQGIGSYLKGRLYKYGINLFDQKRNQELARIGSEKGFLSTIDLSSASDTISYGLVQELLPDSWFSLLERARTGRVVYKGQEIELEKFSGMGNSYTFELESLIFYGLVYGVYRELGLDPSTIGVYGDDIIIETTAFSRVERILQFCGFSLNREKSFSEGPFRESCGADYWNGRDIRPFYQKALVSDRTLFTMHNFFIRRGEHLLAKTVRDFIHPSNLLFGPDGFGDGHLIGSFHLRRNRRIKRMGYEGGFFDTFALTPRKFRRIPEIPFVYPLYCTYVSDSDMTSEPDHCTLPGTLGYHRVSLYILNRGIFH